MLVGLATGQFTYASGPAVLGILRDAGGYWAPLCLCIAQHCGRHHRPTPTRDTGLGGSQLTGPYAPQNAALHRGRAA